MEGGASNACDQQVVGALAKQLGLEFAVVARIFNAGVEHAYRLDKRRRMRVPSTEILSAPTVEATADQAACTFLEATVQSSETPAAAASAPAAVFRFARSDTTLEELRAELAEFAQDREWDQFHAPRNLALALVGEVGKLCECFQWKGKVAEGLPGWTAKERTHLGQEIADVLLYLLRLSHKCHVDLPQAALDKLAVNAAKYPATLVRGSSKKYSEYSRDLSEVRNAA